MLICFKIAHLRRGGTTFSDDRQLAYKGRPRVLSTARFWRPLWRALRFFISTYKLLLSVTPTPLVSTFARLIAPAEFWSNSYGPSEPLEKEPQYGLLLQRMLRLLNHFTREELVSNFVHLEQFK